MSLNTLFHSKTENEFLVNATSLLGKDPQLFDTVIRKLRRQRGTMPFCVGNATRLMERAGDGYRSLKGHNGTVLELEKYLEQALIWKKPGSWQDIILARGPVKTVRFGRRAFGRS